MKQQFGSGRDDKFVSNATRIKSQAVIFCGYWLLNEVLGDYVKWKRFGKCTVKALFPAFGGGIWENEKLQDCRWSNQVSNWR